MKKLSLVFAVAIAATAIWYFGCSVSKDFSFGIDKQFVVSNYNAQTYTSQDVIDAGKSSSDFASHKGDLSRLDVQSATYKITYFSGPADQKITSATLQVGDTKGGAPKLLATVSNVTLSAIQGQEQPLTLTNDGKQFLKDQFMGSTSSAMLYFTATADQTPVTFTVNFHFNLSATYETTVP